MVPLAAIANTVKVTAFKIKIKNGNLDIICIGKINKNWRWFI
jgi:hypothetical protein